MWHCELTTFGRFLVATQNSKRSKRFQAAWTQAAPLQTHAAAMLGFAGEFRRLPSDPFENLSGVLWIFTAEVFKGKRVSCIEVAAEIDPVFRFQRAINTEETIFPIERALKRGVPGLE